MFEEAGYLNISMFKVEDNTESIDAKMLISAKLLERMVGENKKSEEDIKSEWRISQTWKVLKQPLQACLTIDISEQIEGFLNGRNLQSVTKS